MGDIFGIFVPVPQALLDPLIAKIEQLLKPILGPIRTLIGLFTRFRDSTTGLITKAEHLIQSVLSEYNELRNFKFKTEKVKTRVLQPEASFDHLKDLIINVPRDVFEKVQSLVRLIKNRLNISTVNDAVSELEGAEDLRALVSKLGSKFLRIFEKVLGVFLIILDAIEAVNEFFDDLQSIVDDIRKVRSQVEDLTLGIFLQQHNKRERIKLADGSTYYRRIPGSGS